MKIYITRHSKTLWNQEKRLQGWQDSPLSETGIKDALLLKDRIKDLKPSWESQKYEPNFI